MKTRVEIVLVALLSTLLAACCITGQPDTSCRRGDTATIKYGPGMLRVSPECLEVDAGDLITLKLKGDPLESGQAQTRRDSTKGNDKHEKWLEADNSEQRDRIEIVPPAASAAGTGSCGKSVCDFKYEIVIKGVGVLDPRIRVNY